MLKAFALSCLFLAASSHQVPSQDDLVNEGKLNDHKIDFEENEDKAHGGERDEI